MTRSMAQPPIAPKLAMVGYQTPQPKRSINQPVAGKRNRGAVVLKGIDHAGGEARHLASADIHRRGGADDGVRGIRRERNEHEKETADKNPQSASARRRPKK